MERKKKKEKEIGKKEEIKYCIKRETGTAWLRSLLFPLVSVIYRSIPGSMISVGITLFSYYLNRASQCIIGHLFLLSQELTEV